LTVAVSVALSPVKTESSEATNAEVVAEAPSAEMEIVAEPLVSPLALAVTVLEPAVLSVTLNAFVPLASAVAEGTVAWVSPEVMVTESVASNPKLLLASTP